MVTAVAKQEILELRQKHLWYCSSLPTPFFSSFSVDVADLALRSRCRMEARPFAWSEEAAPGFMMKLAEATLIW